MFDRRQLIAALGSLAAVPRAALAAEPRVVAAPFRLDRNRLLITVGINGTGPYDFMIDTGGFVSTIRPELAERLKLPVARQQGVVGIAGRRRTYLIRTARDVVIGGIIRQQGVALQDAFDFAGGQGIEGTLSAGILTAYDTELDFDAGVLRIYPDGRGDRAGFALVDAVIPDGQQSDRASRKIVATLQLDGRALRCVLDTGAPHVLMLNRRVAQRLGYWADAKPWSPYRPNGFGGAGSLGRIVRAERLALGAASAERPLVTLLGDDFAGDVDGIVGLSFIRRFNLSIDAGKRRLWVQPSRQPLVPERYGLSGLWLDRAGAGIVVSAVGTGSPAAQAGLKVGDRIAGEWDAVLRSLGGAPGSRITLTVERGGDTPRPVALALTPYL